MNRRAFLAAAASSVVTASAAAQAPPPALPRFGAAAAYSAARQGVSFLVVRNGIVLGEDYPAGGQPDARWPIAAGTRAMTLLLAGSLVEDRLMSLDEPVALTLSEWGLHPVKAMITIRALLNGTSGVAFQGEGPRDLMSALLLEPRAAPGERFFDDPASYVLMTEIARRKLNFAARIPDPATYLTQRTLGPIGCTPIAWTRDATAAPLFHDGVSVSARGWAQVGELIRRDGIWRANQLVDDDVMREGLRGTFTETRAGMGLWLAAPPRAGGELNIATDIWRVRGAPTDLAMAAGAGGQRLYIIPSDNMIVVRQSQTLDPRADWSDAEFLGLLLRDA